MHNKKLEVGAWALQQLEDVINVANSFETAFASPGLFLHSRQEKRAMVKGKRPKWPLTVAVAPLTSSPANTLCLDLTRQPVHAKAGESFK